MSILRDIISEDYELHGNGRWLKVVDTYNGPSSLVVDEEEGIFYWNAKNIVGDAVVWLTKVKGKSFAEATKIVKNYDGYSGSYVITLENGGEVIVLPRLVDAFWQAGKSKKTREYWYKRGIKDATIDRLQLGFYSGWSTVPIFMDGIFRNFQIRRDTPEKRIKNWYSGVGPLLYNSSILKLTSTVFITEGPTDCIRLIQEGFPAVSHTGGNGGWKTEWNKYFTKQDTIFYCVDTDPAGVVGARKVAENLGEYRVKLITFNKFLKDHNIKDTKGFDVVDFFKSGFTGNDLITLAKDHSIYSFQLKDIHA